MHSESSPGNWLPAWFNSDEIDTVVVGFPDVYGRLMGKRFTRSFFEKSVVKSGTHMCNYLLTVDLEMNPLPGFELASWERGYGDFHAVLDLSTLRKTPWQPGSAIVLCDLAHEDGQPVRPSPRAVLKAQVDRLAKLGWSAWMGSELEFYLYRDSYSEAFERRYRGLTPSSDYLIDYHLLQPARDETLMRRIRNELSQAGIQIEGSKGEWGKGQHEINMEFQEALVMADWHALYKHAAKEITAQENASITFMAKPAADEAGSSFHLHSSLWDLAGSKSQFWDEGAQGPSKIFRQFLAGLMKYGRQFGYCFAPTINAYKRYQSASWAPTTLVWAHDNRTTGLRVIGHGNGLRVENRAPGADANPYLAMAATIAAGLAGIEEGLDCGEPYLGNAYADPALERLPGSLDEAADLLAGSKLARQAFGDDVVEFYAHTARQECKAYREAVTDWERVRYFERI